VLERHYAPLAPLTTLGLGGPAERLVTVDDEAELVEVVRRADDDGEPLLVLGGGSNLVLPDDGLRGTVVRVAVQGLTAHREGEAVRLEVAAGENWDAVVARCVADRLVGVEALSGIPGRVGAAPMQNIGAYGQDISQTLQSVRVYDRTARQLIDLDAESCRFGYRTSRFKTTPGRYLVLAVRLRLQPSELSAPVRYDELAGVLGLPVGGRAPSADVRAAVLALRQRKGMVLDPADPDTRSAGSFFTNPILDADAAGELQARVRSRLGAAAPQWPDGDGKVKFSAAWLIERTGFTKGYGAGPVGLSSKHSLALVNRGGATTTDLLRLARQLRDEVRATFGVELMPEPMIVGAQL